MPNLERSDALAATRAERYIRDALHGQPILPYDLMDDEDAAIIAAAVVKLFAASEEQARLGAGPGQSDARRLVLRGPWEVA